MCLHASITAFPLVSYYSVCIPAGSSSRGKALISVSDKSDLEELAKVDYKCINFPVRDEPALLPQGLTHTDAMLQGLAEHGFEVVSTGGSAAALEQAGVPVQRVEQLTGFPEMLDGTHGTALSPQESTACA